MIRDEANMVEYPDAGIEHPSGSNRAGLAAAGGISGALAASACCILPLVLFSLGVGGVWVGRLAALSPYQPYFVGFAVLAIGYGFRQVYRRPKVACSDCARPLPKRLIKTGLWSATALIAIALVYPYALPYLL
jgi:mercuric ion transport protein